jgi:hypothetical protein
MQKAVFRNAAQRSVLEICVPLYEMSVTLNQTTRRHMQSRFDIYENAGVLAGEDRQHKVQKYDSQTDFSHVFPEVAP